MARKKKVPEIDKIEVITHATFGLLVNPKDKKGRTYYESSDDPYGKGFEADPKRYAKRIKGAIGKELIPRFGNEKTLFVYALIKLDDKEKSPRSEESKEHERRIFKFINKNVPPERFLVFRGLPTKERIKRVFSERKFRFDKDNLKLEFHGETVAGCIPLIRCRMIEALNIPDLLRDFDLSGVRSKINPRTSEKLEGIEGYVRKRTGKHPRTPYKRRYQRPYRA
ncbi:MAG: hypothetical protein ABID38_06070 [Candidatus Diapherotrites archaeon]